MFLLKLGKTLVDQSAQTALVILLQPLNVVLGAFDNAIGIFFDSIGDVILQQSR
jgi:hypothetical protein